MPWDMVLQSIVSDYEQGNVDATVARTRLSSLNLEEISITPDVLQCIYARQRVRVAIQAEFERDFINRNEPALAEAAARVQADLRSEILKIPAQALTTIPSDRLRTGH
jgi:hypothetical protein